jgi:aryl-alcohol dehydrogenase-like predicted oxidoreductase
MSRNKIPKKFEKWSHIWNTWHQKLREKNLSAIAVCLAYPLSLKEVRHVIVGVDNKEQINKIIHESKNKINKKIWSFMNSDDQDLINPTKWVNLF